METQQAIYGRRSIRRYTAEPVPRDTVEAILAATIRAPSAKNAQPWRFVVLEGDPARQLADIMQQTADDLSARGDDIGSLSWTAAVVRQAPVTILVYEAAPPEEIPLHAHEDYHFVMLQSVGGAIQTMLLAAHDHGLGSLWICDVLYCTEPISARFGRAGDRLVAAVSLGHPAESSGPRPRRSWQELTRWLSGEPEIRR